MAFLYGLEVIYSHEMWLSSSKWSVTCTYVTRSGTVTWPSVFQWEPTAVRSWRQCDFNTFMWRDSKTLTHLPVLYKQHADGVLAAEVEYVNVVLNSHLRDGFKFKEGWENNRGEKQGGHEPLHLQQYSKSWYTETHCFRLAFVLMILTTIMVTT